MDGMIIWSPGVTLAGIEKQVILKAFQFFHGNKTSTSIALGISIRTLEARLEEYKKSDEIQEVAIETRRKQREQFLARQRGNPTANEFGSSVLNSTFAPLANTIETIQKSVDTPARVFMEPALEVKPQPVMPLPERKEVQSVPPKPTPSHHPKRSR